MQNNISPKAKENRIKSLLWIPILFVILLVFTLGFIISVRLFTPEDTWICADGQWQKHGNPSSKAPTLECRNLDQKDPAVKQRHIDGVSLGMPNLNNLNPAQSTQEAIASLPNQNPIGPIQIKGGFRFMSPFFDILAELGAKVCEWGRPPENVNTCPSIKVQFQEFFNRQSK